MKTSAICALVSAALLLAGCGGEPTAKPGAAEATPAAKAKLSPLIDHDGADGPGAPRSNEVTAQSAAGQAAGKAASPCSLVSRSEAAKVVGADVLKPIEAPQGPTCIYRYGGGKHTISMAIQALNATAAKRQAGRADSVRIGTKAAFCGRRGQPTMYVPLSAGQVLSVVAPCQIARAFAAQALKRLDA